MAEHSKAYLSNNHFPFDNYQRISFLKCHNDRFGARLHLFPQCRVYMYLSLLQTKNIEFLLLLDSDSQ